MKNQEEEPKEEQEIQNLDQFQIHRGEGNAADGHAPAEDDDTEYTEDEVQFADGEGTKLDEWIDDEDETDDEDEEGE